MTDNTTKRGARDRAEVAGGETYEVDYFARKHGISRDEAQALIDRVGNDRVKLDAAVASKPAASTAKASAASRAPAPRKSSARRATIKSGGSAGGSPKPATAGRPRAKRATAGGTAVAAPAGPVTEAIQRAAAAGTKVAAATKRGSTVAKGKVVSTLFARGAIGTAIDRARSSGAGRAAGLAGAAVAGLMTGLAVNLGRKAAVQAPSALAGDWLEALKLEHRLALGLFDRLQATEDTATARRTALLKQLRHALGKHAFTEENVIYPALRDWGDKADADKLNHDHGYVKQYLYELEAIENGSPAFLERLAAFRAELEAHIREEEDAIFPPLHAGLGEQGNAKVTALANREGFRLA